MTDENKDDDGFKVVRTINKTNNIIPFDGLVVSKSRVTVGRKAIGRILGLGISDELPEKTFIAFYFSEEKRSFRLKRESQAVGGRSFVRPSSTLNGNSQLSSTSMAHMLGTNSAFLSDNHIAKGRYLFDEETKSFVYADIKPGVPVSLEEYRWENRKDAMPGAIVSWPYRKKDGGLRVATGKVLGIDAGTNSPFPTLKIRPLDQEFIETMGDDKPLVKVNLISVIVRRKAE